MTATLTYSVESLEHDDATVRILHLANGDSLTVAAHPDTYDNYCLSCECEAAPLAMVTVLNSEEWEYANDDSQSYCPLCLDTDMCHEDDADSILRERYMDAEADRRYHEAKDEGWL
jgi:hypothetical protein